MKDNRSSYNIAEKLIGKRIGRAQRSSALAEAALFLTKAIDRMGKTVDGTAAMDYDPEESKRGLSVFTALGPVEWKNTKINFIDTPGYLD